MRRANKIRHLEFVNLMDNLKNNFHQGSESSKSLEDIGLKLSKVPDNKITISQNNYIHSMTLTDINREQMAKLQATNLISLRPLSYKTPSDNSTG